MSFTFTAGTSKFNVSYTICFNVSAGTSVFAMVVLEDQLKAVYPEIDMVTTPVGSPVAMVHANNCTSEINAWVGLFREFAELFGMDISQNDLFEKLFKVAMEGDADCGDMMSYGYYSLPISQRAVHSL